MKVKSVPRSIIAAAIASASFAGGLLLSSGPARAGPDVDALALLGKYVFFDNISDPARQSCSTCHVPANGWTAGVAGINKKGVAVTGANPHTVGGRKPPSNAYSSFKPPLQTNFLCTTLGIGPACVGGAFWDGRAGGNDVQVFPGEITHVGDEVFDTLNQETAYAGFKGPLADQALGPFPNDVEQNVPDGDDHGVPGAEAVCRHVASARYADLYRKAWDEPIECDDEPDISFKRIALAVSAWQHSAEVNSFSSRRDDCISKRSDADGVFPCDNFTDEENLGHDLFYGTPSELNPEGINAGCALCHNNKGSGSLGEEDDQVYMDFAYHNLGLPPNYEIENFDPEAPDLGLSKTTELELPPGSLFTHEMHFSTPTLRNVDKRRGKGFPKAYMHNGYFKSLEQVVHFYNTATLKVDGTACLPGTTAAEAMDRDCWPAPELTVGNESSAFGLFGNLGLTGDEEAALVAFLKTLTDIDTPQQPKPYKGSNKKK